MDYTCSCPVQFVIDTNYFVSGLRFIAELLEVIHPPEMVVVIPYVVIQELDKMKAQFWRQQKLMQNHDALGDRAIKAIDLIYKKFLKADPALKGQKVFEYLPDTDMTKMNNDDLILECCRWSDFNALDKNMCVKALIHDVKTVSNHPGPPGALVAEILPLVGTGPVPRAPLPRQIPAPSAVGRKPYPSAVVYNDEPAKADTFANANTNLPPGTVSAPLNDPMGDPHSSDRIPLPAQDELFKSYKLEQGGEQFSKKNKGKAPVAGSRAGTSAQSTSAAVPAGGFGAPVAMGAETASASVVASVLGAPRDTAVVTSPHAWEGRRPRGRRPDAVWQSHGGRPGGHGGPAAAPTPALGLIGTSVAPPTPGPSTDISSCDYDDDDCAMDIDEFEPEVVQTPTPGPSAASSPASRHIDYIDIAAYDTLDVLVGAMNAALLVLLHPYLPSLPASLQPPWAPDAIFALLALHWDTVFHRMLRYSLKSRLSHLEVQARELHRSRTRSENGMTRGVIVTCGDLRRFMDAVEDTLELSAAAGFKEDVPRAKDILAKARKAISQY
ncbi:PIN domain-containing protein [Blyttiomyces helicus]|uniref:PIN domain-containing protein n=1 Tax=Blyttiomyces helicus TaxID=388810 RepID=A0A4P9VZ07_9FUNG|nr:PIN domain-containing protein [Blyttiomyces helicus]|eukprot:RKO84215.1 PIN domain-containing protein [Blyttiomyces helicus]